MSYFRSLAKGSGCYEQLKVVDDMNDSGSLELKPLDGMNNLGVWMIWTILGHETMNIKCYEQHRVIVDMNDSRSWGQGSRCYEQLKVVDDMNDFRSWAKGSRCYSS